MVEKKIAIIDFKNQDSGLKILFPDSGYFILEEEFDRSRINKKYNIHPIVHNKTVNIYDYITDITYDSLFIIAGLYGSLQIYNNKINPFFSIKMKTQLSELIDFINKKTFKYYSSKIFQENL